MERWRWISALDMGGDGWRTINRGEWRDMNIVRDLNHSPGIYPS